MEKSMRTRGQMSEAVSTGIFLTLSGGFQDAYTYYCRGNVFANAQTGNIVLMGSHLAAREWNMAVRYLAPVLAFAGGVYMAEHVKRLHQQDRRFHWTRSIHQFPVGRTAGYEADRNHADREWCHVPSCFGLRTDVCPSGCRILLCRKDRRRPARRLCPPSGKKYGGNAKIPGCQSAITFVYL